MGACCGGMKTGGQKSLPENQKANNVDEKDKCVNGPQGDAAVAKEETPVTADQQQQQLPSDQEAVVNHTADHTQPLTASPDDVELKITEPDRPEPQPAPAACSVEETPAAAVCPELPPATATQPTLTDVENKPSTLLVSEDGGDVARTTNESVSEVTTTPLDHTEVSCTQETTEEVHTTTLVDETLTSTDTSAQKEEEELKVEKVVEDVEPLKPGDDVTVASPDAETSQMSPVVDQTLTSAEGTAVMVEADHTVAAITGGTDDQSKQADIDVVAQESVAEGSITASAVDQQESAPPADVEPARQVPDETAICVDTAPAPPEQHDAEQAEEQLTTETATMAASEAVDTPAATASVEPDAEVGEQPVQHPATDDVEAKSEQMPPTGNADMEAPVNVVAETPAEQDVPAEVTAVAHEEAQPALEETVQSADVDAANASNTDSVPSTDAAAPVVDASMSKPEDAVSSQDDHGSIQPEELPPPITPDRDDAAAAAADVEEGPVTDCYRYVETSSDSTSERPEQHAVNGLVENSEEPTSKPISEPLDHASEVPVTDEP